MSNFDGTAAGLKNIQQLWSCLTALLKDLIGDVDLTKGDLQTQVNDLIKQIGIEGEIHGAIVLASTEEESLIAKTVTLTKDDKVLETKQFDSNGKCIFVNIQEPGDYVVSASDGTDSTSEVVMVTSDNIVNKTVVSCEISLTPVGATVTPVDDVTVLLKCAGIKNGFTTMDEVLADSNTIYLLTSNENAMQYLARSTGFADTVCSHETFMTYLGQSPYVDDTILNSDLWLSKLRQSPYWKQVANISVTIYGGALETITISGLYNSPTVTTNSDGSVSYSLIKGTYTFTGGVSGQSFSRVVTNSTTTVYVMPEGSIYWYGNELIPINLYNTNYMSFGQTWSTTTVSSSKETDHLYISNNVDGKGGTVFVNNIINKDNYSTAHIIYSGSGGGLFGVVANVTANASPYMYSTPSRSTVKNELTVDLASMGSNFYFAFLIGSVVNNSIYAIWLD